MVKLPKRTADQLRAHLGSLPHDALVDLLVEQATRDDDLRDGLLVEAAKRGATTVDLKSFQRSIDAAVLDVDDRYDYPRTSFGYSAEVGRVVGRLDELLEAGQATAVVELAEYALDAVAQAMGVVDDSDGHYAQIVEDLEELHHRACVKAKPDPVDLAGRLFRREVDGEWDIFIGSAGAYSKVLGKKGVAEFRRLAEARWTTVAPVAPGEKDAARYGSRSRISRIMEHLAELAGDFDARIAVRSRDLSMPYDWLRIAELCRDAGRPDEALSWAERGVTAFPENHDPRLDEFLCDEYHRRGRHEDAFALAWSRFAARPDLAPYQRLVAHATKAGAWPERRPTALAVLRKTAKQRTAAAGTHGRWTVAGGPSAQETLIEVLLWEGNSDDAWAEAAQHGCSHRLWLRLAAAREKGHPADAIPIYQREVEQLIDRKNNKTYAEAVKLLGHVRDLFGRAGRPDEFIRYAAEVRASHKAKRNLMALLDAKRW
ncbi:SWIM zinc finger family protein [soil metagenome]